MTLQGFDIRCCGGGVKDIVLRVNGNLWLEDIKGAMVWYCCD